MARVCRVLVDDDDDDDDRNTIPRYIHVPSNDDGESEREHGLLIFVWSDRLSCVYFVFPG